MASKYKNPKESRTDSRNKVLETALKLSLANPAWDFSISSLKQETGLSTGTMYHFFPNGSRDVQIALYLEITRAVKAAILDQCEKNQDQKVLVERMVKNYLCWHLENHDRSLFITRSIDFAYVKDTSPEIVKLQSEFHLKFKAAFANSSKGSSAEGQKIEKFMPLLFGAVQEYIRNWNLSGRDEQELKKAMGIIPEFLLNGLNSFFKNNKKDT